MKNKKSYPNCEKLAERQEEYKVIMDFLEGIGSVQLGEFNHDLGVEMMMPISNKSRFVLRYLGVDDLELELERREMLNEASKCS